MTELGRFGVWRAHGDFTPEEARELERLGYGTLWLGGSPPAELPGVAELLAATETISVATSIVNVWSAPAKEVAESFHRLDARYPGRFLLGIGAGHPEMTGEYRKPYEVLVEYLDELDRAGVPKERRALAALGPRVLRLAGDRTAGALPYLVTPEHTRGAREILGPDALLAVEHKVVLDTDPVRARAQAIPRVEFYLDLRNYASNLRRLGFQDADLVKPGSARLLDALVAHGSAKSVVEQLIRHIDAGADHVVLQVLDDDSMATLRTLAPLLHESS
ncbi:LLM class F420-dependent oxidoreductase [Nocardia otitidiscaviarum]|uniref:LLM class F420-dependent oxidoreductase n=1 Tax=Nocardia otitidiscaviarum TaxID=1823 RepID=UPI001893EE39|nr:LLM class F420-dependent oxidoreductase [Nocardia otitidiscaviarum]MBF6235731.1 LLM class F420-dependent oxidoreductase [Nocardia otitidiscaviarum]